MTRLTHCRRMQPTVYILTNKPRGTLYTGVTSELRARFGKHISEASDGFTARYRLHMLVYVERHQRMIDAIRREKQIKEWKRIWKIELVERFNPGWPDLRDEL